jgi:hypothetical protein
MKLRLEETGRLLADASTMLELINRLLLAQKQTLGLRNRKSGFERLVPGVEPPVSYPGVGLPLPTLIGHRIASAGTGASTA